MKSITCIVLGLFSTLCFSQIPNRATDWFLEYHCSWLKDSEVNSAHVFNLVVEVNDTLFALSNTGCYYSNDGMSWENYEVDSVGHITGLIHLDSDILFQNYDYQVFNRRGEVVYECARLFGKNWLFTCNEISSYDGSIISSTDTINVDYDVSRVFSPVEGVFLVVSRGEERRSIIYFNSHELELSELGSHAIVSCHSTDSTIFVLTDSDLWSLKLKGNEYSIEHMYSVPAGSKLIDLDGDIYLEAPDGLTAINKSASPLLRSLLFSLQVEQIIKFKNTYVLFSRSNGLTYLKSTGTSLFWSPSTFSGQVDGVFLDDRNNIHAVKRFNTFCDASVEFDSSMIKYSCNPPWRMSLDGVDYVFADSIRRNPIEVDDNNGVRIYHDVHFFDVDPDEFPVFIDKHRVYSWSTSKGPSVERYYIEDDIIGFGRFHVGREEFYWISSMERIFVLDANFRLDYTIDMPHARSVYALPSGLLIGSYGRGMSFYSYEKKSLVEVVVDRKSLYDYIAEIGFQDGLFYLFSNSGIFYSDSSHVVSSINRGTPIVLMGKGSNGQYEVNGGCFNSSVRRSQSRLISTTIGLLKWDLPSVDFFKDSLELSQLSQQASIRQVLFVFDDEEDRWVRTNQVPSNSRSLFFYTDDMSWIYLVENEENNAVYVFMSLAVVLSILLLLVLVYSRRRGMRYQLEKKAQSANMNLGWKLQNEDRDRRSMGAFVKLVEHDLKGNVGVIKSVTNSLRKDVPNRVQSVLDVIQSHVEKMTEHIEFAFNDIMGGQTETCSLSNMIDASIEEVEDYVSLKKQKIVIGEILDVKMEHCLMLKRCFLVILGNAIKFSPEGAPITIDFKISENSVTIFVEDEGPGLPDEWHVNREKRMGSLGEEGLGIALDQAMELCKHYGGNLYLESKPERGVIAVLEWRLSSTKNDK